MRVFRPMYTDKKTGKLKHQHKYWVEFRDHRGRLRRLPACHHKRDADALGRHAEALAQFASRGDRPSEALQCWLGGLPETILGRLRQWGLITSTKTATIECLAEHCEDFERSLCAKGRTAQHIRETVGAVTGIMDGCRFIHWRDIDASRVEHYLADLREVHGTSARTYNQKLKAFKQFCAWMVRERRAIESPVRHLGTLNVRTDRRRVRRALTPDEARRLLGVAGQDERQYGMDGKERALLYHVAMETGLRAGELRSLSPGAVDSKARTITIQAAYSKRRCEDVLKLKPNTALALARHSSKKALSGRLFNMPSKDRLAAMLRADLKEANIPYQDEQGRYLDFHSFRHTFGTWLAEGGVHPKVAQELMRHSDINLTMNTYTHVLREHETDALSNLPNLDLPGAMSARFEATGTDGQGHSDLSQNLSQSCNHQRISAYPDEHSARRQDTEKSPLARQKRCFPARIAEKGKTGERGLEPRLTEPESVVLPLHYSPIVTDRCQCTGCGCTFQTENSESAPIRTVKTSARGALDRRAALKTEKIMLR
jgi:integrase